MAFICIAGFTCDKKIEIRLKCKCYIEIAYKTVKLKYENTFEIEQLKSVKFHMWVNMLLYKISK